MAGLVQDLLQERDKDLSLKKNIVQKLNQYLQPPAPEPELEIQGLLYRKNFSVLEPSPTLPSEWTNANPSLTIKTDAKNSNPKTLKPNPNKFKANYTPTKNSPQSPTAKNIKKFTTLINFTDLSTFLLLLEKKATLISEFKAFLDLAHQITSSDSIGSNFWEDFAWLGLQINNINKTLIKFVGKFQFQGLFQPKNNSVPENPRKFPKKKIDNEIFSMKISEISEKSEKTDLQELRHFLGELHSESIVKARQKDLVKFLPFKKFSLLDKTIDVDASVGSGSGDRGGGKEKLWFLEKRWCVGGGMSSEEERGLLKVVVDCGGVLKSF